MSAHGEEAVDQAHESKPETSTSTSTSPCNSSSAATPIPYMFTTKSGTDLATFQSYIKTLPDEGNGNQMVFPHLPWQSYVTTLTAEQAKDVASQPFVNFVTLITESDDRDY